MALAERAGLCQGFPPATQRDRTLLARPTLTLSKAKTLSGPQAGRVPSEASSEEAASGVSLNSQPQR